MLYRRKRPNGDELEIGDSGAKVLMRLIWAAVILMLVLAGYSPDAVDGILRWLRF